MWMDVSQEANFKATFDVRIMICVSQEANVNVCAYLYSLLIK
jgi:hypothetical protein